LSFTGSNVTAELSGGVMTVVLSVSLSDGVAVFQDRVSYTFTCF
jgi:hypothetical protein